MLLAVDAILQSARNRPSGQPGRLARLKMAAESGSNQNGSAPVVTPETASGSGSDTQLFTR